MAIKTTKIGPFDLVTSREFETSVWWTLLLNSVKVGEGCSRDEQMASREATDTAVSILRAEATRLDLTL
jgi:hypothetical protein